MASFSVRSDTLSRPMNRGELDTLPRTLATNNRLKEDSDDENMLGPPQLSNFGSALLSDKENIEPGLQGLHNKMRLGKSFGVLADSPKLIGKEGMSNNNKRSKDLYGTLSNAANLHTTTYSEEHSDSTMFGNSKDQQQSMTTFNPELQADLGKSYSSTLDNRDSNSASKLKNLQQALKDELSTRGSRRRNRRFISSRLSLLGPAKRASSATATPDKIGISEDFNDSHSFRTSGVASAENNSGYNVFYDPQQEASSSPDKIVDYKDTNASYENIEFGELNPYQFLKKHNLPTTELPNISRAYFEQQKGQNRRTALRKHTLTKDAIHGRLTTASLSNSPFLRQNEILRREDSFTKREPRRKISEGSVNCISKAFSSPVLGVASTIENSNNHTKQHLHDDKYEAVKIPNRSSTGYFPKREALSNININNSNASQPLQKKLKYSLDGIEDRHENRGGLENQQGDPILHHNSSALPARKHVEILEPVRSAKHCSPKPSTAGSDFSNRKRPLVCVNGTEYEKLELLGRGGTSKVYKVKSSANNKVYALKRVSFDEFDDSSVDGFKGEIELLKKLETKPRVVRLIDHEMDSGILYLVMECGDHDLSQTLAQRSGMDLDVEFVRYHAQEMLKCVQVVHEAGIVHSDLKPANFVFVKGILKIIDFGIANAVPDHTVNIYRETQIGTPNYMAPEALVAMNFTQDQPADQNKWKVGKPSDIWSCGCIIYQMIYGRPPYGGFQGQNRLLAIMNPEVKIVYPEKTPSGDIVPKTAIDTMKACLEREPDKRWTVYEALSGPFVKPIAVTHFFIRDLIKNSVKYGFNQRELSSDKIEELADDVWHRLADFRL
ncbi:LAME_0G05842g1_1 [Lachancea meyersii CBS 8951]|uniref:LAME_0G05842g1_1 n=1 Tax=Lachancea meyersii CBS 8951 TaxID=1266667 RepID=A0A1G4K7C0_9SACH|nr:LAME_0G05842g1_1 [Lachancea meyersii CBS 8951]